MMTADVLTEPGTPLRKSRRFWLRLAAFLLCSVPLALSVLYRSPSQLAIESVGGEIDEAHVANKTERLISLLKRGTGNPGPRQIYFGPRDQRLSNDRQVYNEKLDDETILKVNFAEFVPLSIVDISGPNVTDRGFSHVAGHPGVSIVICRRSHLTDDGLLSILNNPSLNGLHVPGNRLTDNVFDTLGQATSLSWINLSDTLITDDGLRKFSSGPQSLRMLQLSSTDVTDQGLLALASTSRLTVLGIDVAQCSDSGVSNLRTALPGLNYLIVSTCSRQKQLRLGPEATARLPSIDDEMIARISTIQSLTSLVLQGTRRGDQAELTSKSVASLKSLPALTNLNLIGITVPAEFLQQLRKEMPALGIMSWPGESDDQPTE